MSSSAFTPLNTYQPASATVDGVVTTTDQTFAGIKTFQGGAVITGITDGSAGSATSVGYLLSGSRLAASPLATVTANTYDVCAITLTPGEWLLNGWVGLKGTATSVTGIIATYGTGSVATPPEQDRLVQVNLTQNLGSGNIVIALPGINVSRTGSNIDYNLRVYVGYTSGTCSLYGAISARRMR